MLRGVPIQSAQRVYMLFFLVVAHLLVRTFIEFAMLRIFLFSLGLTEFRVELTYCHHLSTYFIAGFIVAVVNFESYF
jgi:hypothetical protein